MSIAALSGHEADPKRGDLLIVGGGCAGLSLAVHLVEAGIQRRITIIEGRESYRRDRTWCYFAMEPHPFEAAVTHRWSHVEVCAQGKRLRRHCGSHPYVHLPADAFYRSALEKLSKHETVELHLGCALRRLEERKGAVVAEVQYADGRAQQIVAQLAFDSRPRTRASDPHHVHFKQHFRGWFVRTRGACFDPRAVTLMDFEVEQRPGVHFTYVLPFDAHSALVEDTHISVGELPEEAYEDYLSRYLAGLGAEPYVIEAKERGVIPMTSAPFAGKRGQRIYPIGLPGGLARPSTGYAFQAIQRYSREMARNLASQLVPAVPALRSERTAFLDRVFLSYLAHQPGDGPDLFFKLFQRVPMPVVTRFLSDRGTLQDDLRVVTALSRLGLALEPLRSPGRAFLPRLRPQAQQ